MKLSLRTFLAVATALSLSLTACKGDEPENEGGVKQHPTNQAITAHLAQI